MIKARQLGVAALMFALAASACSHRVPGCDDDVPRGVRLLPGEVFLTSCPLGERRYRIAGKGFLPHESIDAVLGDEADEFIEVRPAAFTSDGTGELHAEIAVSPQARYLTLYGDQGSSAWTPLVIAAPPAPDL